MQIKKTSLGLDENLASMLCYAGWWVTGIVFLIIEGDNRFVRFHAIQSTIVFGIVTVGWAILTMIPIIGRFLSLIVGLLAFALWIALIIRTFQGEKYKLPWAGNIAERYSGQKTA